MNLGGMQKLSLSDYPGRLAAVLFTRGCNYRCPFCHNPQLVTGPCAELDPDNVLAFLERRRGQLDGVVVSGGEPTLQADLPAWLERLRALGYAIKLDTNGSRPWVLESLLEAGLVDHVAIDLKAPAARYSELAGHPVDPAPVLQSIALLARSGVSHELRTTVVPSLLDESDLRTMARLVPPGTRWVLQPFVDRRTLDPDLPGRAEPLDATRLGRWADRLRGAEPGLLYVVVRGVREAGQGSSSASRSSRA